MYHPDKLKYIIKANREFTQEEIENSTKITEWVIYMDSTEIVELVGSISKDKESWCIRYMKEGPNGEKVTTDELYKEVGRRLAEKLGKASVEKRRYFIDNWIIDEFEDIMIANYQLTPFDDIDEIQLPEGFEVIVDLTKIEVI